jgi:hypothetical protein
VSTGNTSASKGAGVKSKIQLKLYDEAEAMRMMVEEELAELNPVQRCYVQGYLDGVAATLPSDIGPITDDDTLDAIRSMDECEKMHPDWFVEPAQHTRRGSADLEEVHSLASVPTIGTVMTHAIHAGQFTVIGSKHEGTGRGYSVRARDETGEVHHYRTHRLEVVG